MKIGAIAGLTLICGALCCDRAQAKGSAICFDSSSPSARLDKNVARAAASLMHADLAIQPYDGSTGVSERFFRFLARTQCSLIMGFPVDTVNPDPPSGLALTRSYLKTAYVIASLHHHRTLASIPTGAVVSVGSSTVPNFYLVGALGPARSFVSDVHLTQDEALDALVHHQTSVAMVWAPSVAVYAAGHTASHIVMTALPIPHAQWSLAALYAQPAAAFAKRFNTALATLHTNGSLARYSAAAGLELK